VRTAVAGAREADVRRTAVEESADLERTDDGGAVRERVRLDLGGVLARRVRIRVGAHLGQRDVGRRGRRRRQSGDQGDGGQERRAHVRPPCAGRALVPASDPTTRDRPVSQGLSRRQWRLPTANTQLVKYETVKNETVTIRDRDRSD